MEAGSESVKLGTLATAPLVNSGFDDSFNQKVTAPAVVWKKQTKSRKVRVVDKSISEFQKKAFYVVLAVLIPMTAYFVYTLYYHDIERHRRYPLAEVPNVMDLWPVLIAYPFFLALRPTWKRFIGGRFFKNFMNPKLTDPVQLEDKIQKAGMDSFYCLVYVGLTLFGYWVGHDKDWAPWYFAGHGDSTNCWRFFNEQHIETDVKWYYSVQIAFSISLLTLNFIEHGKRDFLEMAIHHFATLFLLVFSYMCGYVRIGCLVLAVHDVCDIFVFAAKSISETRFEIAGAIGYFSMVISWAFFRLYLFPTKVIYSASVESSNQYRADYGGVGQVIFGWYFFNGLLMVLQILHVYWFALFIRLGYRIARGYTNDVIAGDGDVAEKEE